MEEVDIDHDVVVLFLVSHYVHVHVEPFLLAAVMRVACAVPRARGLGRRPAGREVDCSWQTATFKLAQYSCDNDRFGQGMYRYLGAGSVKLLRWISSVRRAQG